MNILIKKIYEDNVNGKLSDKRFEMLLADYETEQSELELSVDALEKTLNDYQENADNVDKFIELVHRYTEQSIRNMMKFYTKKAGIERNITPHMFRHSFATYLIEEGVDVSCVQQILGHSSIKTTQIYIHVAAKKQAEILQNRHPRNKMRIINVA